MRKAPLCRRSSHTLLNFRYLAISISLFLILCYVAVLIHLEQPSISLAKNRPENLQQQENIEKDVSPALQMTPDISQKFDTDPKLGVIIQVNAGGQRIDWEDGKCTLSEAILSANQSLPERPIISGECLKGQGNDTIIFDGLSTVTLTVPYESDPHSGSTGLPPITSIMTISGGTQGVLIRRDPGSSELFRILRIEGSEGRLVLDKITLQGGTLPKYSSGDTGIRYLYIRGTRQAYTPHPIFFTPTPSTLIPTQTPTPIVLTPTPTSQDPNANSFSAHSLGGAILVHAQGTLTLVNQSLITNSFAGDGGGGIYATQQSRVTLIDSMINNTTVGRSTDNYISTIGGGIYVDGESRATFIHSSIREANAQRGGAIGVKRGSTLEINNSYIAHNTASAFQPKQDNRGGGGIYADTSSHIILNDSDIVSNTVENGPGAAIMIDVDLNGFGEPKQISTEGRIVIKNSRITHNVCFPEDYSQWGGAISSKTSEVTIIDSDISYNQCVNAGGIVSYQGDLTIKNSQVTHNKGIGLVIYGGKSAQILDNTEMSGNHGGINSRVRTEIIDSHVFNNTKYGILSLHSNLIVCNSSIMNNGGRRGGVSIHGHPDLKSTARFINSHISYNEIDRQGDYVPIYSPLDLMVFNSWIPEHSYDTRLSTIHGGGIYSEWSFVTIKNSELIHNYISGPQQLIKGKGGAITAMHDSRLHISHSSIAYNVSSEGGGIFVGEGSELLLADSQIVNNQALMGGAFQNQGSSVVIRNSTIADNSHTAITGMGTITATHNWWGQADGPSGAGLGSGDSVAMGVNFSNFYTAPVSISEISYPCYDDIALQYLSATSLKPPSFWKRFYNVLYSFWR